MEGYQACHKNSRDPLFNTAVAAAAENIAAVNPASRSSHTCGQLLCCPCLLGRCCNKKYMFL